MTDRFGVLVRPGEQRSEKRKYCPACWKTFSAAVPDDLLLEFQHNANCARIVFLLGSGQPLDGRDNVRDICACTEDKQVQQGRDCP